jgi:hypothetical protein
METIQIPKELLWDYKEPPDDLLWRLQRIADFFPAYGTDRETVKLLWKYRNQLKLEEGTNKLIVLYHEVWNEKTRKRHQR